MTEVPLAFFISLVLNLTTGDVIMHQKYMPADTCEQLVYSLKRTEVPGFFTIAECRKPGPQI